MNKRMLVITGICIAVISIPLLIFWDVLAGANRTIQQHGKDLTIRIATFKATDSSRAPFLLPPVPGNAWPHYQKAFAEMRGFSDVEQDAFPSVEGNDPPSPPDAARIDAVLAAHKTMFDELRVAAASTQVDPGYNLEDGAAMLMPEVASALKMAKIIGDIAALRHQQGRDGEAIDWIVLGLITGLDIGAKSPLVGVLVREVISGIELDQLSRILESHSLAAMDLEKLAGTMDFINRARGTTWGWMATEWTCMKAAMLEVGRGGGFAFGPSFAAGPRHLFSSKFVAAEALNLWDGIEKRYQALAGLPYLVASAKSDAILAEVTAQKNPVLNSVMPAYSRIFRTLAAGRMKWILARGAVAIAWHRAEKGADPATLAELVPRFLGNLEDCPIAGKPIQYSTKTGTATLYSFGGDKDDDGGKPVPDEEWESDGDVVRTVKSK